MFGHRRLKRRNQSVQRNKEEEEEIDMHSVLLRPSGARLSGRGLISARHVAKTNDANGSAANALGRIDVMRCALDAAQSVVARLG